VKSLVATPSVLAMMSAKLDWMQKLGDAVLAQQPDVMDAVQRLRARAQANNKLPSTKEQKVSATQQENKDVIVIEPAVPDTVYVPYYDPSVVYGAWPYADYPPYYFSPPLGYVPGAILATGIAFGAGYALGRWASGGRYWGGGVNWGGNNININRGNIIGSGNTWQHNPAHRQGVRYNNASVQQKFGNNNLRTGAADRLDFRGKSGQQVLNPGANRPNAGDRAGNVGDRGGANRANVADRRAGNAGSRGNVGNRAANVSNRAASANPVRGGGGGLNVSSGAAASAASARGRASVASAGGGGFSAGGGSRGGGRFSGGGGGRGGGGGGGRRSDIALKHDVVLLGHLANGLGYYRFSYVGSHKAYVGVIAQEAESVMPEAVTHGNDGFLRVYYEKLGLKFRSYDDWLAGGARIPTEVTP
jgi:hypothetical protein